MARPLVSPPLASPPPSATLPTSLTSGSTTEPTATPLAAALGTANPSPLAPGSTSSSPLSARARPFHPEEPRTAGRSKFLRWSEGSPGSSSPGALFTDGASSFRDVAALVRPPLQETPPPVIVKPPPRIVLRSEVHVPAASKPQPDADGWVKVVPHASRRQSLPLGRRERRPVPVDLRGRCFNCFSDAHRAAPCRSRPRCFKCKELGHRAAVCSRREGLPPGRVLVWRRISPAWGTTS